MRLLLKTSTYMIFLMGSHAFAASGIGDSVYISASDREVSIVQRRRQTLEDLDLREAEDKSRLDTWERQDLAEALHTAQDAKSLGDQKRYWAKRVVDSDTQREKAETVRDVANNLRWIKKACVANYSRRFLRERGFKKRFFWRALPLEDLKLLAIFFQSLKDLLENNMHEDWGALIDINRGEDKLNIPRKSILRRVGESIVDGAKDFAVAGAVVGGVVGAMELSNRGDRGY